jgi:K+/H+ antiporter YhaU regulatory subunit KhtT
MSLWEKVMRGLEEGASTVSERAAMFLKKAAGAFEGGAERASDYIVYTSKLARVKSERRQIHRTIRGELAELGGRAYGLFSQGKEARIENETKANVRRLRSLEADLTRTEGQMDELRKEFEKQRIDKGSLQGLRADLETGGGTIVQAVLGEQSSMVGKRLKDIRLPEDTLLGTIVRGDKVVIPDGQTLLRAGDKVTLLGKTEDVERALEQMNVAGRE